MTLLGTVDPVVEWMRERGVRRLRLPDGLEVELATMAREEPGAAARTRTFAGDALGSSLADDRPAPVVQAFADDDGAGVCACGHSWLDHNELGCLHGCSHAACMSQESSEPEQAS